MFNVVGSCHSAFLPAESEDLPACGRDRSMYLDVALVYFSLVIFGVEHLLICLFVICKSVWMRCF